MIEEQYDILLELQKIDIEIDEEEKKKKSLPLMLEGITKKIQGLKDNLKKKNIKYTFIPSNEEEFKKQFSDLKITHTVSPIENPLQLRKIRKTVARIATELTNRELQSR